MTYKQNGRSNWRKRSFSSNRNANRRGPKKENIHPSKFIKTANVEEKGAYNSVNLFSDFKLNNLLQKNIAKRSFAQTSPIQDQAIPHGLDGKDIIGIANTGTGKTVAFALPVINKLLNNRNSRVLIMAPTRELAEQILEEFKMFAQGGNLKWTLLIGGARMGFQLRELSRKPQIVIGTPGRIKDHLNRRSLDLKNFDNIVLDEVDRMLDMGFINDMRAILKNVSEKRQSFFFSATMNDKVRVLINEFAKDPVIISVKTGDTSDNVEQNIVKYSSLEDKIQKLQNLLTDKKTERFLIFDETKRGVDKLSKLLCSKGFKAEATHGNKSLSQRKRALARFKTKQTSVLVATDVAARGLDVSDINYVINYSTPQSYSDYVHRIGRAGRAGKIGYALTFIQGR